MQPKSKENTTYVIRFYKRVYLTVKSLSTSKGDILKLVWTRDKMKAVEFSSIESAEDFIAQNKLLEAKILKSKML